MISRRDFGKVTIAALLSLLVPKEFNMPDQSYSGDYFLKLLRNLYNRAGVTPPTSDFATLQRLVDNERDIYEKMRSFPQLQDVVLKHPRISQPVWGTSPLNAYHMQRIGAQTIPNNTETAVSWNTRTPNNPLFSNTDVSAKLLLPDNIDNAGLHRTIGVIGTVEWEAHATGRRGFHVNVYDASDALITGYVLHSLPGSSIAENTLPFAGGLYFPSFAAARYLRFTVTQTSGGDLNLNGARIFLFQLI